MKNVILLFFVSFACVGRAQTSDYKISSFMTEGNLAPNTHYIGKAWLGGLVQDDGEMKYNIAKATFAANSTLDWHKHVTVQVLVILEGEGYYQERGKEPIIVKKGDVIKCEKDTEHWHASTKYDAVSYLAIYGGAQPTIWTEKLTQEYYDGVAEKLKKNK